MAEAEGNRTPLRRDPPHNGFEDRAGHQAEYASLRPSAQVDGPNSPDPIVRRGSLGCVANP